MDGAPVRTERTAPQRSGEDRTARTSHNHGQVTTLLHTGRVGHGSSGASTPSGVCGSGGPPLD